MQKIWQAETSWRKWSITTIAVSFSVVLGAALLAFVVDPHYRYRAPFFYDMVYYEIYATAPHILKNQKYDLLMLGTSMTRNFFINDIDSAFDCRSVKLSAAGGTMQDLCKFFEVAQQSRKEKLKRVIWSLDIYTLNKTGSYYADFDYLYREDHKEDYRYLFSRRTFSSMFYLLKRKLRPKRNRFHQVDRNRMFSTDYDGKPYGLRQIIASAFYNERFHHTQTPFNLQNHQKNFYDRLLPVFDNNPQIHFTVFLPPYHIYTYCLSEYFGESDALILQRSSVMKELLKRKNVTLHDFQADGSYVEDSDHFSDVQHFNNAAARKVLDDLVSGRRRIVTPEDVDANEKELRKLIKKNMPRYRKHIEELKGV